MRLRDKEKETSILSDSTTENIYHCNKCGLCLAACPVYKEVLVEPASPRGKVQLSRHILEGDLELSPHMKEILSRCLLCGSCVAACPSGVHGDHLIAGLRWRAVQKYGLDWKKRALFQILSRKWMTSSSSRMARWARSLFGWALEAGGLRLGSLPVDRVPPFNNSPFESQLPEVIEPKGERRGRVIYFHGCATNYLYDTIGHAVIKVLTSMGMEVKVPKGQPCCGIPIFLSGAREMSIHNMRGVMEVLSSSEDEPVIVDCATCGVALRNEYAHILQELSDLGEDIGDKEIEGAEALASRTLDVMEFVEKYMDLLPELKTPLEGGIRITYHDPCHLLKGQGIGVEPRRVIRAIPGVEFVEMKGADTCCGGGGSFQVEYPEISSAITRRKVEAIEATDAQVVATGCPGCRLTISAHLDPSRGIRVLHPVELVSLALNGSS